MKSQGVQLLQVDRRELLAGAPGIEFVERVAPTLHAAVAEVAGVGGHAVVGQLRRSAIDGEISRRRRVRAAGNQPCSGGGEAEEVEDVRRGINRGTVRDTTEGVAELMKRDTDQQVRIDVGSERVRAIV